MLKVKNLKKLFIVTMVLMLLIVMQVSVSATSGSSGVLPTTNNTTGTIQTIPTTNNSAGGTITSIPTTNSITTNKPETTNQSKGTVTVTVTANKQVQSITGWSLSSDKKVLTKTYTTNTTESITLTDLSGVKSDPIQIKVDMSLTNGGTNVNQTLGSSDTTKPVATVKYAKNVGSSQNGNNNTNSTNLPKTGIDYSALFIILVCVISGVYAYIKIRDYNEIKY